MIVRYLSVVAGAFVITAGLLYFMQSVAVRMTGGSSTLYYVVSDFIPAPDRGRQRPQAPPAPETAPARPAVSVQHEEPGSMSAALPDAVNEAAGLRIEPVQPLEAAGPSPVVGAE